MRVHLATNHSRRHIFLQFVLIAVLSSSLLGRASSQARESGHTANSPLVETYSVIRIAPSLYINLLSEYDSVQIRGRKEFFLCLTGGMRGDTVFIDGFVRVSIVLAHLIAIIPVDNACTSVEGVVAWVHSHAPNHFFSAKQQLPCQLSDHDWDFWRSYRDVFVVAILMCEGGEFNAYFRGEIPHIADPMMFTKTSPPPALAQEPNYSLCQLGPYSQWCDNIERQP